MRFARTGIVVVSVLVAGALGVPLAMADEPLRYVALGDSSAAGPGIPDQIDATCLRSNHNWPHVLATTLGAELTDVTCSGATTQHLAGSQFSGVVPQFDALRADTTLVTLAIGANDIGMGFAFQTCAVATPTCQEQYTRGGVDLYAAAVQATAPKITAALDEIRKRSPRAKMVLVGYLTYWRPGGCPETDLYPTQSANYLQATSDRLLAMLADRAAAAGVTYVDIRTPSAQHGLCEAPGYRWLEGAQPASPALAYHPNTTGMSRVASIIAGVANLH